MYCECGCGQITKKYARTHTRDGAFKGQHKRFINGHQNRSSTDVTRIQHAYAHAEMEAIRKGRKLPEDKTPQEILLTRLMRELMAGDYTPDEMFKLLASDKEYNVAVVMAHAKKSLDANGASTNIVYNRGIGTPKTSKKSAQDKPSLADTYGGSDGEDDDDLYVE